MKLPVILLIAVLANSLPTDAQNSTTATAKASPSSDASSHLQLTASTRVQYEGALVGKARCDEAGNIYARLAHAEGGDGSTVPIQKIKPDGSLAATFRVADAMPDIFATDFFVSGSGKVYAEAWNRKSSVYVVEFSSDGSISSKVTLDAEPFAPYQIAVFKSGEFLLSGTLAKPGGKYHAPFTAVFDASGRLIRRIYEPEDEDSRLKAEAGDQDFVFDGGTSNSSVYEGDAATGSDGNIYLLRALSPALIYAISSKGEVLRKLRIDSPISGLVAQRVMSGPGRLAISFLGKNSTAGMTKVVDFQGNPIVDYTSDDEKVYPGLPGCYAPPAFTFLDDDGEDHVYLHRAEPK